MSATGTGPRNGPRALEVAEAAMRAGRYGGIPPFLVTCLSDDPARQCAFAQNFAETRIKSAVRTAFGHDRATRAARGGRLRIGYVSTDFREHPVGHLIAGMFDRHDRAGFEVFAYSIAAGDDSVYRRRIAAGVDHFVDAFQQSAVAIALRIATDAIDILVDLTGYTGGAMVQIFAFRPAPIQVNWLGYPGTMGADFIDYILADRTIAPAEAARDFAETLVHLPFVYQMNDDRQSIVDDGPDRAACGLPPDGFVFASFNTVYKITPPIFAIWMRLLAAVPGSVLWLLRSNAMAEANLRAAARAAGIYPSRLVFAERAAKPVHLARHRHADLFLDTRPVKAHTTASDALWAVLPVLTCPGASFIARVAASLVTTAGLPELVARNLAEYEAIALRLARDPATRAALRDRLRAEAPRSPLFSIPGARSPHSRRPIARCGGAGSRGCRPPRSRSRIRAPAGAGDEPRHRPRHRRGGLHRKPSRRPPRRALPGGRGGQSPDRRCPQPRAGARGGPLRQARRQ
ncbi:MAG: hypothetical protein FJX67_05965 [Alphaproteobacteria bacterium]|nr:hypothetical protein [Alphaproteobacteria bacterium]